MRARIKDIAAALDLSISTVQSVLRNNPGFKESTRKLVFDKAAELNYRRNWLASSLATSSTHVFGVVVPNLSRSIFPDVLEGIDEVAHTAGYNLLVCNTGENSAREDDEIATLIGRQVDGLIVASAHLRENRGFWKTISKAGVPFVLIDRFFPSVPFVSSDDERIGWMTTQHLIEQGYKSIAYLGRQNVITAIYRRRGYVRALRQAGIRIRRNYMLDVMGDIEGYAAVKQMLQLSPRPDALFAASDSVAIGALRALGHLGIRVPEDFGVIGVGKARYGEDLRVPLSTVDQHPVEIGKTAASILVDLVEGKPGPRKPVLIESKLIVRASSRRIS
jgi:LacI family transcriptional regulator